MGLRHAVNVRACGLPLECIHGEEQAESHVLPLEASGLTITAWAAFSQAD